MQYNQLGQVRPQMTGPYAKASMSKGRTSVSKTRYGQVYERALKDKISQQMLSHSQMQRHTPSSASFSMNISTLELIEFVLREYEQTNPVMLQPTNRKSSYTIYEDLKIVYCLGKDEGSINFASFKRLAEEGYVRRTQESIKSRYIDFLKNLTKDDYQNILSYIELNGLKGFLVFEKDDKGTRLLQRIQKTDPKTHPQSDHLQIGSHQNLSGNHTPSRSPRGMEQDRSISPNAFPYSPSKQRMNAAAYNGFMPYFMPGYGFPQMYPQQDGRMSSPFKHPYFDSSPYPFYMNPYMGYPPPPYGNPMMRGPDMCQEDSRERDLSPFEVRPSMKQSTHKSHHMKDEGEYDRSAQLDQLENVTKKQKGNEKNVQETQMKHAQKIVQKQHEQQQFHHMFQMENMQKNAGLNKQGQKIQTTILPKYQPLPKQNMMPIDSELKQQTQSNKALTKEVYDLISDEDRIPEDQFENLIVYFAEQVRMTKERIVDILDSLSGSFNDFSVYLDTKQENMLWNPEEDKILSQIKSQDSSEFKLLCKLKGLPSIKKRIIYNNIALPFCVV